MILTTPWLQDWTTEMQIAAENAYANMLVNPWWQTFTKTRTDAKTKKMRLTWILETAHIMSLMKGSVTFEDLMTHQTEFDHDYAGTTGLRVDAEQFEDMDGTGIQQVESWNQQTAALFGYWPQLKAAEILLTNPTAYDGEAFFSAAHPCNPAAPTSDTYKNLFTDKPLDSSVTEVAALANLEDVLAYIRSEVKTPNGLYPRKLVPTHIIHPPKMSGRIQMLTQAKVLARTFGSTSGASQDYEPIIQKLGLATPIEAPELAAAYGGSDTDCYIVCKDIVAGDIGGLVYSVIDPFEIVYHSEVDSPEFRKARKLEYWSRGRNVMAVGHPFAIFKVEGA